MKTMRLLAVACLCLRLLPAVAGVEMFDFSGNVNEQRYMTLISQLRCLVCQNQTLADSDAELAHDLRVEVYEHMRVMGISSSTSRRSSRPRTCSGMDPSCCWPWACCCW
jgi:cytochrome c-type biogenesis protein CcmH/NrfF